MPIAVPFAAVARRTPAAAAVPTLLAGAGVPALLAGACALALLAGGCAPARAPDARAASTVPRYFGSTTPPAENVFRFNNGAEPETVDPALAVGQPDGRVCRILFEGLAVPDPVTLAPLPGQAERWELSRDGLTYTFHLRPGLTWSDGRPLTARDFVWSWLRVLRPETASRYAALLYPIANAEAFNRGTLRDESRVGVRAADDTTFIVTLDHPVAFFPYLTEFYTYLPVPRQAIEAYGPRWTLPQNIVTNGPFRLAAWRQGDRFEFARSPRYWDAAHVGLDRVIAYPIEDLNTSVNLYKAGVIDWTTSGFIPSQFLPYLRGYSDFQHAPYDGIWYFSINVTRKPLDNIWVRRALNYATDREAIARDVLHGTRFAWGNFTPMGYPGYMAPPGIRFDAAKARDCLARAGYPGGRGFPKISILTNTSEDSRRIMEALQEMWKRTLNIDVELVNEEWGSYLQSCTTLHYDIAKRSWIGDYLDPSTFLGTMVTGDGNNRSGWGDPRYDALLRAAGVEVDPAKRMRMLSEAEGILLDAAPLIPIYHMTVNDLVKPWVRGITPNALDTHPLKFVWIDRGWREKPAPVASAAPAPRDARAAAARAAAAPPPGGTR